MYPCASRLCFIQVFATSHRIVISPFTHVVDALDSRNARHTPIALVRNPCFHAHVILFIQMPCFLETPRGGTVTSFQASPLRSRIALAGESFHHAFERVSWGRRSYQFVNINIIKAMKAHMMPINGLPVAMKMLAMRMQHQNGTWFMGSPIEEG
jgi:hypothetical protein